MYSGKAQGLSTVDSVVSALMGSYDVQNFKMWRLDDVEYVRQRQQWREDDIRRRHAWRLQDIERVRRLEKLANERCLIDIRTEQLLHISQISIVVAYFARVAYVESQIPKNGNPIIVALQGSSAALGVLCMIMCMIIVVLIQIAVARYATEDLEDQLRAVKIEHLDVVSPFTQWWLLRCEKDWHMAFTLFRTGIVLVLLTIAFLSWLQYTKNFGVGVSISTLSCLTLIYWFCRMQPRWPEVHAFPMHDD
ncbi:hypothetical protein SDRG_08418 [Saprolegnia diclina VS20]|uniref:Uncharacterized protein n=1 Tax=Saprolegnia diclina (strain VS20) TaxID=1156394 RepID=T0QKB4_SAPDV|nr:hypothetical protein SDRG_08418 [Saprolegnia diclina VS20]EQC34215.1 hypothetical protein SDRG_08418 [Saprolegnia diclina VS20]|eukprot:XP_008612527.1 hypothetical protein SDRG_08418 [Saprolegnia diclina VS20]